MDELFKNLRSVLEKYGQKLKEEYKNQLASGRHNASGKLGDSLQFQIDTGSSSIELSLELEDYWVYLENGTSPHWPNIDKIRQWIRIKPVAPRPLKNGKLPTEEQLTFLISRKISLEGTKPLGLMEKAEDTIWDAMLSDIEEAIEKDLTEELDDILLFLFK